ncbi:MAG: ABC transporter ATP-binding protein [Acidobacteria bacterium]|nr:ABC transporter ATP-binding protein [Acidobacteriota bacterium]
MSVTSSGASASLLRVEGLSKSFAARGLFGGARGTAVPAVRDVSFDVPPGQTLALVGESGSGKTTTARLVLRLLAADAGRVTFDGVDWLPLPAGELREKRREMSVVFQDPATSLNPRLTVERLVGEPLEIHAVGTRAERRERVRALLARVGLPEAALSRTPREFSGGQRQRIGIARALATEPRLVVLDEPVSALDVSVRAQVLNLLLELQETTPSRPAYLFIGHDLAVVRLLAPRTAVMFRGQIVEEGPTGELFSNPRHPYTRLLLASQPAAHPSERKRGGAADAVEGGPPAPRGCAFRGRCPSARARCAEEEPQETVDGDHRFRCHFPS